MTGQGKARQDMTVGTGVWGVGKYKVGMGEEGRDKIKAMRTGSDRRDRKMERIVRQVNNTIQHR